MINELMLPIGIVYNLRGLTELQQISIIFVRLEAFMVRLKLEFQVLTFTNAGLAYGSMAQSDSMARN